MRAARFRELDTHRLYVPNDQREPRVVEDSPPGRRRCGSKDYPALPVAANKQLAVSYNLLQTFVDARKVGEKSLDRMQMREAGMKDLNSDTLVCNASMTFTLV
jgi:hypothetical protein